MFSSGKLKKLKRFRFLWGGLSSVRSSVTKLAGVVCARGAGYVAPQEVRPPGPVGWPGQHGPTRNKKIAIEGKVAFDFFASRFVYLCLPAVLFELCC